MDNALTGTPAARAAGAPTPARGARFGAVAVTFAFWATMIGTTVPTPLYPLYREAFHFSSLMVTVIFAVYALGVVAGLLTFGRLSDQIGRRPVLIAAALLAICAAAVFLAAQSVTLMLVARVFSGFSAALVTGAATASLTELIPAHGRVRAAVVALFANMGGLACGTLLAGVLADLAPAPLRTPWVVTLVLVVIGLIGVAAAPESNARPSGFRLRLQPLRIPGEIRGPFIRSAMAAGSGFAVLGVLTSVTGLFLGSVLETPSHSLAGLVVFLAFVSTALGQLLVHAVKPSIALPAACAGLIAGSALIATAMATASLTPLIAAAVIDGLATGIAVGDGIDTIATRTAPRHRGEAVSTYFAILYAMLAVPAIGDGVLIETAQLRPAGEIFSGLVAALALTVLLSLTRAEPARD